MRVSQSNYGDMHQILVFQRTQPDSIFVKVKQKSSTSVPVIVTRTSRSQIAYHIKDPGISDSVVTVNQVDAEAQTIGLSNTIRYI